MSVSIKSSMRWRWALRCGEKPDGKQLPAVPQNKHEGRNHAKGTHLLRLVYELIAENLVCSVGTKGPQGHCFHAHLPANPL